MPRIDRETNDVAESGSCPTVRGFMKSSVKSVKNGELPEVWMRFLNALSGEQTVEQKKRDKENGTRGRTGRRPGAASSWPLPTCQSQHEAGWALMPVTMAPRELQN